MKVLGVVAKTHDSGIAVVQDGVPELIFEEERFNRTKKTKKFPKHSLRAARTDFGLNLTDVEVITTPWDLRRLRRTALSLLARRFPLSLSLLLPSTHEAQQNQIMVLNSYLRRGLTESFATSALPPIVNVGHHDAHAAVFFVSPFEEALVLVMDGYGDDASSSAYLGRGNRLERTWSTGVMNSVGLVYTFVTQHLGFAGFGDEGKVMALAAFGSDTYLQRFRDVIRPAADGGYAVDMSYFSYDKFGQLRPFSRKFIETFGPPRAVDEQLSDRHRDLAFALQTVTEEVILNRVRVLLKQSPVRDLCMTGGVALNCVANAKVLEATDVRRLWVPPCASDTGAPLGSALWHTHQTLGLPRRFELTHPYYGCAYADADIAGALEAEGLSYHRLSGPQLIRRVAQDLSDGKIVGWFQGRFEMGPRALGNRSILADPRRAEMRDELNDRVKKREPFRPFAPVVLAERAAEYFEVAQPDPFMTLAPRVRADKQGVIPAAVHVDGTGRIQTIDRAGNPRYYGLIEEFGRLTGVPVLLNTSFNRKEPIVASPKDAIACYLLSGIDVLVLGDFYTTDRRNSGNDATHAVETTAADVTPAR
ncbi:MAG TPA: carbamoyltransferase C-terminal domain-containing protein [Hyphomicrobiaceae bacterium]|nr:carbamoyltransferase C-terminal domain-containing protein [Hyphomicrobiaceae bacterium]